MNSPDLKRLLEKPWFPETLVTRTCYERTQDDCDGNPLKGRISVIIDEQGDVWFEAIDIETHSQASLRFRTYMGGGMSLRTRQALLFLCEAIRLDNEECPQRVVTQEDADPK